MQPDLSLRELRRALQAEQHNLSGSSGPVESGSDAHLHDGGSSHAIAARDRYEKARRAIQEATGAMRRLLKERSVAIAEMVDAGLCDSVAARIALDGPAPPPAGLTVVPPLRPADGPSTYPAAVDLDSVARIASGHHQTLVASVITPLRDLAAAMSTEDAQFFGLTGESIRSLARTGGTSSASYRGDIGASSVDVWSAYASFWKDPSVTVSMLHLADVPALLAAYALPEEPSASGGGVSTSDLLPMAIVAIGSSLVCLSSVLSRPLPRLVQHECLEAVASIAQGLVSASWRSLVCRLDRRTWSPLADRQEEITAYRTPSVELFASHPFRSPTPPFAMCDAAAVVGAELLRDAALCTGHMDFDAMGDDDESAVSLAGTRAPATRAHAEVSSLLDLVHNRLAPLARDSVTRSIGKLFDHCVAPDYVGQTWEAHNIFYKDRVPSHAVRFSTMHVRLQWLSPAAKALAAAVPLDPSQYLVAPWTSSRDVLRSVVRALLAAEVAEWRRIVTRTKATAARTTQLWADVVFLVLRTRRLRSWYAIDDIDDAIAPTVKEGQGSEASSSDPIDSVLLNLVALASVRCSDFVSLARATCRHRGDSVPEDLLQPAESAPRASPSRFWDIVWNVAPVPVDHTIVEASPLRCYDYSVLPTVDSALKSACQDEQPNGASQHHEPSGMSLTSTTTAASAWVSSRLLHREVMKACAFPPGVFDPLPPDTVLSFRASATTDEGCSMAAPTLADVLPATGPESVGEQLRLRWELWAVYPMLEEDDEIAAKEYLMATLPPSQPVREAD